MGNRHAVVALFLFIWSFATVSQLGVESQAAQRAGEALKDPRDGRSYRTVQIGPAIWMQENLGYEAGNSWCYDGLHRNCTKYGRLYAYQAAQTACPAGWHLPDETEWDAMLAHFGIKPSGGDRFGAQRRYNSSFDVLLSGGNSGFGLLLSGVADIDGVRPTFRHLGDVGNYWSNRRFLGRDANAYSFSLTGGTPTPIFYTFYGNGGRSSYAFSVRCVKDQDSPR